MEAKLKQYGISEMTTNPQDFISRKDHARICDARVSAREADLQVTVLPLVCLSVCQSGSLSAQEADLQVTVLPLVCLSVYQSTGLCNLLLNPSACLKTCLSAVFVLSVHLSVCLTTSTQQVKSPAMLRFLTLNFLVRRISFLKCLRGCSLSLQGAWRRVSTTSNTRWIRCRRAWLMLTRLTSARSALLCLSALTHCLLPTHLSPLDAPAVPPVPCGSTHCLSILTHCLQHTHLCPLDAPAVPTVPCGSTRYCPL